MYATRERRCADVLVYGVAATLSPIYVQALQAGYSFSYSTTMFVQTYACCNSTGISGLGISSLRVVTKVFFPDNAAGIVTSAYLFFFLAAVLTICCMAGWLMLSRRREIFMHEKHQLVRTLLVFCLRNAFISSPIHPRRRTRQWRPPLPSRCQCWWAAHRGRKSAAFSQRSTP